MDGYVNLIKLLLVSTSEMDKANKELEKRYEARITVRRIFDSVPQGVMIWDTSSSAPEQWILVYVNDAAIQRAHGDLKAREGETMREAFPDMMNNAAITETMFECGRRQESRRVSLTHGRDTMQPGSYEVTVVGLAEDRVAVIYEQVSDIIMSRS